VTLLAPDKVKQFLQQRNHNALRRMLARSNFADIADLLENTLTEGEAVQCFQVMNMGQAAQVLVSLSEDRQQACLSSLPALMSSQILRVMAVDDAVDILQDLDLTQTQRILEEMPFDHETRALHHLLLEEPDTAAGIMSMDFVAIPVSSSVGEAMQRIRAADNRFFIYYIYLLDNHQTLVGVVGLKRLLHHTEATPLSDIATFDVKSILIHFDQELVANVFRKYYNLLAMPVVDEYNHLRGIITLDDIVDVIEEESSEDIYRGSGINVEAIDEKHLLTGPVIDAVKARLPWLCVTLVGQLVAANIISSYHETVSAATIAISYMPMLSGLSGNMGTQSETIAVRGLALNLITNDNFMDKLRRELGVSLITGITFSTAAFLLTFLQYQHLLLSSLLACSVMIILCLASSLGIFLPYAYQKYFKQDPAGVGGPFITTLLDILTFTAYLSLVTALIKYMI
jgi:magnesium transporter